AVEEFVHAGYDLDAAAILLAESDGTREEVADETAKMIEVMRACGATGIRCSRDEAERLRFWSGRKAAFPAVGRISPDYYCIDGSIPRAALAPDGLLNPGKAVPTLHRCAEMGAMRVHAGKLAHPGLPRF